ELLVIVMRSVRPRRRFEADGLIQNGVVRTGALVNHSRVDVRLERRTHLPQRLRNAIEFGFVEVASTNHRFDSAGRVVDGQQRALRSRILLQAYLRGSI